MNKTLLLSICLLAGSVTVHAQTPARTANPAPETRVNRPLSEAEFIRLRELLRPYFPKPPESTLPQQDVRGLVQRFFEQYPGIVQRAASRVDQQPTNKPLGVTFGGWDASQGEFSPLNGLSRDLEGLRQNLEGLKNLRLEGLNFESVSQGIETLKQHKESVLALDRPPVFRSTNEKLDEGLVASASSRGPSRPDKSGEIAAAARLRPRRIITRYNSKIPGSNTRDGNRVKGSFPIDSGSKAYDSKGNPRPGTIEDSSVRLNFGGKRTIKVGGTLETAYSAWHFDLDNGQNASALVLADDLRGSKPQMDSLMPPRPPNEGRTAYLMTGGDPNSEPWSRNGVTFKVRPNYDGLGQNSTDYGYRAGGYVNLCYNVPNTGTGGVCFDTFKVNQTTFHREQSVHSIKVPLYYPSKKAEVSQGHLTFVYGFVNTPTGPRYGWVPLEALQKK